MTESPRKILVAAFVFLGGALILASFFLNLSSKKISKREELVQVQLMTGSARLFRAGASQKENLIRAAGLGHLDSIETLELGEVRLDFPGRDRLRLGEQSLLTLEKVEDQKGFHLVALLKRGQLWVENVGTAGDLYIGKNGERIAAGDYNASMLAKAEIKNKTANPGEEYEQLQAQKTTGLSEADVQNVLSGHRTSFLKCYAQLLQKDPTAKGDATLSFTILNSGKVSSVSATSTKLENPDFKNCLSEVMKRIEFRPFEGPVVSSLFPLKFE